MRGRYQSLAPFLLWRQLERPCKWERLYPRPGPLSLEIGFGNGEYLCRQAQARPAENFVGLELHWDSVRRTMRRLAQLELDNVRLVMMDVRVALERLFAPQSLSSFCALFPCPWPKHKHEHHRLFSTSFMQLLNSRLQSGAEGLIVTDHVELHRHILRHLGPSGFKFELKIMPPRFNTKYERRWAGEGQSEFYEFHLVKSEHIPVPVPEEVSLVTFHVPDFKADSFAPPMQRGELIIEFKDFLYDPQREIAMVMAMVVEETLTQAFWIEIVKTDRGWAISPAAGGGVVPTRGVHRALELVRDHAA